MAERLGLFLARMALRITRNHALADACSVLPLIPARRFAIFVKPWDPSLFPQISEGPWAVWRQAGEDQHQCYVPPPVPREVSCSAPPEGLTRYISAHLVEVGELHDS